VSYIVTEFARDSEVRKILRVVVFYLGWAQGFPHKNSCVLYFPHYLPIIVSRSVNNISLTDCSRKLGKNTIHPSLVSCTLKSTELLSNREYSYLYLGDLHCNQISIVFIH